MSEIVESSVIDISEEEQKKVEIKPLDSIVKSYHGAKGKTIASRILQLQTRSKANGHVIYTGETETEFLVEFESTELKRLWLTDEYFK